MSERSRERMHRHPDIQDSDSSQLSTLFSGYCLSIFALSSGFVWLFSWMFGGLLAVINVVPLVKH